MQTPFEPSVPTRAEVNLDRSLLKTADLAAVIEGHNEHTVEGKETIRRFDGMTPYAVHPIWCGTSILTEPALPIEIRRIGSQALFYHDFLEDLNVSLPDWISPEVRTLIDELTFHEGSAEKKEKVWTRSPVGQLCVLYDVVSNFLDKSWMTPEKEAQNAQFVRDLATTVEAKFGALNITKMAHALAELTPDARAANHSGEGWHMLRYIPEVRMSVAHLATSIKEIDGEKHYFGILNKKALEKGQRLYGALGGAAELVEGAHEAITSRFGARDFEGRDARFVVSGEAALEFSALLRSGDQGLIECDIEREMTEEFTQEVLLSGADSILTPEQLARISIKPVGLYQQPFVVSGDTSARQTSAPSVRLFFMHELVADKDVVAAILSHASINVFTEAEVASTHGGAVKGKTTDGASIANNIFSY